jgi:hypothetical protein
MTKKSVWLVSTRTVTDGAPAEGHRCVHPSAKTLASKQSLVWRYPQASYARGVVNAPLQKRIQTNYAGGAKGVIEYGMCSTT